MAVVLSEETGGGRASLPLPRARRWLQIPTAERALRCAGQVAMFGVFGACTVAINLLVAPCCRVFTRDRARRAAIARAAIYRVTQAYVGCMQTLRLIDVEIIDLEQRAAPGTLYVANHPSLLDALVLLGHLQDAVVVAKRALQVNLFTGGCIRAANYIVTTDAAPLVEECRSRIAGGESLLLFPECTRTAPDGVIRLRRGAAQIAVRSQCPVVPITIEYSLPVLAKGGRWWLAPMARPHVRVVRHTAIDPSQFGAPESGVTMAARRLTDHLQRLFMQELSRRGPA